MPLYKNILILSPSNNFFSISFFSIYLACLDLNNVLKDENPLKIDFYRGFDKRFECQNS